CDPITDPRHPCGRSSADPHPHTALEIPMIELHQFRPFWGLPNASPFCMKAETYLRYRGLPFRAVPSGPRRSPTGQIPFIVDDGQVIADSEAIIRHYEAR